MNDDTDAAALYEPSQGVACTSNGQCTSGFCVDGVCCTARAPVTSAWRATCRNPCTCSPAQRVACRTARVHNARHLYGGRLRSVWGSGDLPGDRLLSR